MSTVTFVQTPFKEKFKFEDFQLYRLNTEMKTCMHMSLGAILFTKSFLIIICLWFVY